MFGTKSNGAAAYAKVNLETGVLAASSHQLIMMLFDGAMVSISSAMRHMLAKEIAPKGEAISRAISIIENGLRASLDKPAGGELAQNLDSLYAYIANRLLMANLNNKPELLEEAYKLLKDLREAWETIEPKAANAPKPQTVTAQSAPAARALYDALAPATRHLVKA